LRPGCRLLQFPGNLFVGLLGRLCPVPGASIRIEFRIDRLRKSPVGLASLVRAGRLIDSGANQRVTERHSWAKDQQSFRLGYVNGRGWDSESFCRSPHERRIPDRIGRRDE
jgi:hypothetical protein